MTSKTAHDPTVYVTWHAMHRFKERVSKARQKRISTAGSVRDYLAHLAVHGELLHQPVIETFKGQAITCFHKADRDSVAVCHAPMSDPHNVRVVTVMDKASCTTYTAPRRTRRLKRPWGRWPSW